MNAECGDGYTWNLQNGVEECDDANGVESDSCLSSCVGAVCGDGVVWAGVETCDDGNENSGDGCTSDCLLVEEGWSCYVEGEP